MMTGIAVQQTTPNTVQIDMPLSGAAEIVEQALANTKKAQLLEKFATQFLGQYKFGGGDLILPFTMNFREIKGRTTIVEIGFDHEQPEWRTDMARETIISAICQFNDALITPSDAPPADPISGGPTRSEQSPFQKAAFPKKLTPAVTPSSSSNYSTTSAVGSFIAGIGWAGAAFSMLLASIIATSEGLIGLLVGFVGLFFCLLTIATGQLLRAQVEIANNSRLILALLKRSESI